MPRDIRRLISLVGVLFTLSAVAMLIVPAENIWPWVLMFGSIGLGLLIGAGLSTDHEDRSPTQP